jgi:hypothetical protein
LICNIEVTKGKREQNASEPLPLVGLQFQPLQILIPFSKTWKSSLGYVSVTIFYFKWYLSSLVKVVIISEPVPSTAGGFVYSMPKQLLY